MRSKAAGRPMKNEVGNKYGRWTVLKFSHIQVHKNNTKDYYWLAKCTCGTVKKVYLCNLKKGKSVSCGCYNREITAALPRPHKKPHGIAARNQLFHAYKRGASKRNLEFKITIDDFSHLTKQNCHYCGVVPRQLTTVAKNGMNGDYIYNGIDRMDSKKGYIASNCLPCCKTCNYAKRDSSYDEFKKWIKRLTTFNKEIQ